MPDETVIAETEVVADSQTTEPVVETTQESAQPQDETTQRLDRIVAQRLGKYAERTRRAEEKAVQLQERIARMEGHLAGQTAQQQPAPQQQKSWSQDELQSLLDAGKITPAQMAGQLALQAKEVAKQELRQEFRHESVRQSAAGEVKEYLTRVPALDNTASPEFQRVSRAASEIADEMGLDIRDARVQRRALRETFGTLDRITKVKDAQDYNRQHADTYTEVGGGGGRRPATDKTDPLKQVGEDWLTYNRRFVSTDADLRALAQQELVRRASRRRKTG